MQGELVVYYKLSSLFINIRGGNLTVSIFCKGKEVSKYGFTYNFSHCYGKIVLCWYVDLLECRLRNYAKKLIFKEFVR